MRPWPAIALCAIFFFVVNATDCNFNVLVKCYIEVLDDWAWTLFELKSNVVTITEDKCVHLRELERCINDKNPEQHNCNHQEVLDASRTVSDLLTHRKNSGTFLTSYYLLDFACSSRGQELLSESRKCLADERIGEMTMSAATYLTNKFIDNGELSPAESCDELNMKLSEYQRAMHPMCEGRAAEIMCESLLGLFKGVHADRLAKCQFHQCAADAPAEDVQSPAAANGVDEDGEPNEETPDISREGEALGDANGQQAVSVTTAVLVIGLSLLMMGRP